MDSAGLLFSLVIPTYRRHAQLRACLEGIAALDYPREGFEVVVVDDGSGHAPSHVVDAVRPRVNVRLVEQPHAGPATARNTGARLARAPYLVFIDDDCVPAADYLRVLDRAFIAHPDAAVGGRTINSVAENPYSAASQGLIDYLYGYFNATAVDARFVASNNLALPLRRFLEIGGFDTSFPFAAAEDRDLCDRWREHGFEMRFVPSAVVHHAHRMTLRGFLRQHFTYGRGGVHLQRARGGRGRQGPRFQPARFYVGLLAHPLRQRGRRAPVVAALTALSQAAYAAGDYLERMQHRGVPKAHARARRPAPLPLSPQRAEPRVRA
jgi:GT2 family glycosyltransferase